VELGSDGGHRAVAGGLEIMTKAEIERQAERVVEMVRRDLVQPGGRGVGRKAWRVSTVEAKASRARVLEEIDYLRKMVAGYGVVY
jgi:hypothetical protein